MKLKISDDEARNILKHGFGLDGTFVVECYRKGKLIWTEKAPNVCTAEGLNALLDIMFHAATQITTWYLEIYESDTAGADGLTYATPTYTPCTSYDEATRPAFNEAAASGKSITNSANKGVFTISATKTIYGVALVGGGTDGDTKGDAAGGGTLFSAGKFAASKACEDDDVLNVTYTLTAADA